MIKLPTSIIRLSAPDSPLVGGSLNRPYWTIPDSFPVCRIQSAFFVVTASATVANRVPVLKITDQATNQCARYTADIAAPVTATEVVNVTFMQGGEFLYGVLGMQVPLGDAVVGPGDTIGVFGFEVDDSFTSAMLTLLPI